MWTNSVLIDATWSQFDSDIQGFARNVRIGQVNFWGGGNRHTHQPTMTQKWQQRNKKAPTTIIIERNLLYTSQVSVYKVEFPLEVALLFCCTFCTYSLTDWRRVSTTGCAKWTGTAAKVSLSPFQHYRIPLRCPKNSTVSWWIVVCRFCCAVGGLILLEWCRCFLDGIATWRWQYKQGRTPSSACFSLNTEADGRTIGVWRQ